MSGINLSKNLTIEIHANTIIFEAGLQILHLFFKGVVKAVKGI